MLTASPAAFEHLAPEDQAARLLFHREHGMSVRMLAAEMSLPFERVELALCRAISTLAQRGYEPEFLCQTFRLTRAQLKRAATAAPFGDAFQPLGTWRWRDELPDADEEAEAEAQAAEQSAA
jgi:hypothetical protein